MAALFGLFASAFLAATILPFSSEAVLAALTVSDGADVFLLWTVASAGNILGAIVNWLLGRFCLHWSDRRWFPVKPPELERAQRWFSRYGLWSLLFAWVPIIGDPLTVVAGFLKVRLSWFVPLVAIGKGGRYAVVIVLAQRALGS